MKTSFRLILTLFSVLSITMYAQEKDPVIENIIKEAKENSQLERLGHELMDVIGPRLVGTPQMKKANDWAVAQYEKWGISAKNEKWGDWRGWERGITHIDMIYPRIETLDGTQLAWNPGTSKKGITAEMIALPSVKDSISFQKWLVNVEDKFVMISMNQPTGRPDYNWEEFATEESFKKMKEERESQTKEWRENIRKTGYNRRSIISALENAGAAGLVSSSWSKGFGVNKIFSARTKKIPMVDLELEDYTMLYRMVDYGNKPQKLKLLLNQRNWVLCQVLIQLRKLKG